MKSNWISSFGEFNGVKWFCSVLGKLGFKFLPESLHGMQLSHFLWIASVSFGHQKCFAAMVILLIAGCPLWRSEMTVVLRFAGTIIFSSENTNPYLVDNFRLYWLYSSGMLSYCFLSKHTGVFNTLGSFVVSVINNWRSVANYFSVSLTVFPWSQLFGSIACILGACPILMY